MPVYRSFLFAPGNHPRRVEKSLTLGADAVILDLEDAVANAEKPSTRAVVVEALQRPRRCQGYVRVNSLGTQWCPWRLRRGRERGRRRRRVAQSRNRERSENR